MLEIQTLRSKNFGLAMAPNLTRCSGVRIARGYVTNWNLGTASYAMISKSVNLVTFETPRSTRPPLISQAWALFFAAPSET
jgi:hypothetical protein